jgi:hypothetical protein
MSYLRVIPRDLFNEANLLKCLGRLSILCDPFEGTGFEDYVEGGFQIEQDPNSGAISVANLEFFVRMERHSLFRPLNSRRSWPLYLQTPDEDILVFDDDGNLSQEMLSYINELRTTTTGGR